MNPGFTTAFSKDVFGKRGSGFFCSRVPVVEEGDGSLVETRGKGMKQGEWPGASLFFMERNGGRGANGLGCCGCRDRAPLQQLGAKINQLVQQY